MSDREDHSKEALPDDEDNMSDEEEERDMDNLDEEDDRLEDEDEEDEDEEDEEDEEDSDQPMRRSAKRSSSKGTKSKRRRFAAEAVFDEFAEEEDSEEEETSGEEGFINEEQRLKELEYAKHLTRKGRDDYDMVLNRLEQKAHLEDSQSKLKPITKKKITQIPLHEKEKTEDDKEAADLYRQEVQQATVTEYNNTRVLPTINDPKIYSVRVRRGSEQQAVLSLTYKYQEYEGRRLENNYSRNETDIFSVFWTGEESIVYIESYDETMVRRVVDGMSLFLSAYRNAFHLIPIEDRTMLLDRVEHVNRPLQLNAFVRLKKGLYKGDLAQVVRLMENDQKVVLRLVPRLDLSEFNGGSYSASKVRPPQKFFDPSKFPDGRVERRNNSKLGGMFFEYNRQYFRDGMLYKEFAIPDLLRDIQPSVEEKAMFADRKTLAPEDIFGGGDTEEIEKEPVEVEHESGKRRVKLFYKGDKIRVISGELKHLEGVVEESDDTHGEVQIRVTVGDESELLLLKEEELMKVFATGTHVRVLAGVNAGETGVVAMCDDEGEGNVIVISDFGDKEMKVFVNNLIESAEVSSGVMSVEGFDLFDLVVIPFGKVGIIIQLAPTVLTVLDQSGKVCSFDIKKIRSKRNMVSKTAVVMDVRQNQLREGDAVLIVEGDYKGKRGTVKRLWRNLVFVKCSSVNENNGIVLARNRQVELDADNQVKKRFDSKENVEMQSLRPGQVDFASTKLGSRNKKELLKDGTQVMVTEGRYKGLRGYILDSNDTHVKIVFQSRPQPVSIPRTIVKATDGMSIDNAEMEFSGMPQQQDAETKPNGGWNPPGNWE